MMKRIIDQIILLGAVTALCQALLISGGCRRDGEQTVHTPPSAESAPSRESGTPYYTGLIEEYRALLAEDPHNLAALIALGNAMYDAGQWKGAIQHYEQALQIDPHGADVLTDMGTCYRNLALPDKAIEIYERVLSMEPAHQNALYNLGIVYGEDKKDYQSAIAYWEQLLHVAPKHSRAEMIKTSLREYKQALRKQSRGKQAS